MANLDLSLVPINMLPACMASQHGLEAMNSKI